MANEMRDKLFELLTDCEIEYAQYLSEECDKAIKGDVTKQLFKRLEFYADRLIENGVIVPPCKVGDVCYPLPRHRTPIIERRISRITYSARNRIIGYYENDGQYRPPLRTRILGEDVFLTKAEAEQKLKEMRGENE